jgi:hypothetical protein
MRASSFNRDVGSAVGLTLLGLTIIFILFTLLPFYGHGIHLRSHGEIFGSQVDFKGFAPFVWPLARIPATALALVGAILTPYLSLLLGPLLLVSLRLNWRHFRRQQRWLWIGTLAVNAASLLLTWPSLDLIRLWLAD